MIIIGAGGHARELLEVLLDEEYTDTIIFFDNISDRKILLNNYRIINSIQELETLPIEIKFCSGIGNPKYRKELSKSFEALGFKPSNIISKKAFIGKNVRLGNNLNIMPFATITNSVEIGTGTLIHFYSSIHHDAKVGQFCEISPGARILGGCEIGDLTSIGSNATVLPNIKIGNNCIIGAGSIVTKNVKDGMVVKGIPAK